VGGFTNSLGYADNINSSSIFVAIKNGLHAGTVSLGINTGGPFSPLKPFKNFIRFLVDLCLLILDSTENKLFFNSTFLFE